MHNKEKSYWNLRYGAGGNSGYGSYGEQLTRKLNWLLPMKFESICEVGCGDFNFGSHILAEHQECKKYVGLDISDTIIRKNQKLFPQHTFEVFEGFIYPADLLMCVDVLFHIIDDDDAERMIQDLEKAWKKYLVITAYERDEEKHNHVRIREFDYKRFGEPLVREVVEADGMLYFYIFKK